MGGLWILLWRWQTYIQAAWIDRWPREWTSRTSRGQFWWIGGMRWEVWEWTECSIGGGEEIEGYEDGGPPTLCQPASQQGDGEEVNNLAGGAWRGLEECWGFGLIFVHLLSIKESVFNRLWARGWSGLPMFQLLAEMNGKRWFGESESVSIIIVCILLFLRFWGQCLKRCRTRKYSQ